MTSHTVLSSDGTTISHTTTGSGPGIVVVPGNNRMAHNYEWLATALSGSFTVHVMERRGRGGSGPQGEHYSLAREVEDLEAVLTSTGSTSVFGHSYGGLIALRAASLHRSIEKLVVYEPGVSINGSYDLSWLPRFEELFRDGKLTAATVEFLQKSGISAVSAWPRPLLWVLAALLLRGQSGREMKMLMPTTPGELREILRADSDGSPYRNISADTMLLAGEQGARPLLAILPTLQTMIPNATYRLLPKLNHNAPDLGPVDAIVACVRQHLLNTRAPS